MCLVFCFSHIGNSRENQEDNYLLGRCFLSSEQIRDITEKRKLLMDSLEVDSDFCIAISDGMGGHEYGEIASLLTVEYLASHYDEMIQDVRENKDKIIEYVSGINEYVCDVGKKHYSAENLGATLCGIISIDETVYCFNVGDSRLYQYSNAQIKQITVDNTEGQRLIDYNLLTKEEVEKFPYKKSLYKYVGKDVKLVPDVYNIDNIEKGTLLLLCSDGLSDVLKSEEMQDILSKECISTEEKGKFMLELALERKPGMGDNITLMIVEY